MLSSVSQVFRRSPICRTKFDRARLIGHVLLGIPCWVFSGGSALSDPPYWTFPIGFVILGMPYRVLSVGHYLLGVPIENSLLDTPCWVCPIGNDLLIVSRTSERPSERVLLGMS